MKLDLHIHTHHSYDCWMKPAKIIKIAQKKDLGGVAIVDHQEFGGAVKVEKECHPELVSGSLGKPPFFIIKGQEIKTEYGDVVGLFLNKKVNSQKFLDVVDEIKNQDGLVVMPHPGKTIFPEETLKYFDLIEISNARSKKKWNNYAQKLVKKTDKPVSCGSDAHSYFEIGRGFVTLHAENLEEIKHK